MKNKFHEGVSAEGIAKKMQVHTAKLGALDNYIYTVIFAKHRDKWLFCRHKDRDVFETAGGRIEIGETPLDAARREFIEETGAVEFSITPAFDYSVLRANVTTYGQVFFADVSVLGDMPDFEMAEVRLFDALPDALRFPEITPALFEYLQGWLHNRDMDDELWDLYDSSRRLIGKTHRRGDPLPRGYYHLVVCVCIQNSNGQYLVTKRAENKSKAGKWEFQGGCATAGDDSLRAALREVKEETGIELCPSKGAIAYTAQGKNAFLDVWKFKHDFNINDIVLQPGETVDAKIVTQDEIRIMVEKDEFAHDFSEKLFS